MRSNTDSQSFSRWYILSIYRLLPSQSHTHRHTRARCLAVQCTFLSLEVYDTEILIYLQDTCPEIGNAFKQYSTLRNSPHCLISIALILTFTWFGHFRNIWWNCPCHLIENMECFKGVYFNQHHFISLSFDPACNQGVLLDIVFVLDSSNRLGSNNFNSVRDFASRVVQQFVVDQNNVRVGVVTFADNARNEVYLNERRNVASDIRNIG